MMNGQVFEPVTSIVVFFFERLMSMRFLRAKSESSGNFNSDVDGVIVRLVA